MLTHKQKRFLDISKLDNIYNTCKPNKSHDGIFKSSLVERMWKRRSPPCTTQTGKETLKRKSKNTLLTHKMDGLLFGQKFKGLFRLQKPEF